MLVLLIQETTSLNVKPIMKLLINLDVIVAVPIAYVMKYMSKDINKVKILEV